MLSKKSFLLLVLPAALLYTHPITADTINNQLSDLLTNVSQLIEEQSLEEKRSQSSAFNRPTQKDKLKKLEQALLQLQQEHQKQTTRVHELEHEHLKLQGDYAALEKEHTALKEHASQSTEAENLVLKLHEEIENLQRLHEDYFVEITDLEDEVSLQKEVLKDELLKELQAFNERSKKFFKQ